MSIEKRRVRPKDRADPDRLSSATGGPLRQGERGFVWILLAIGAAALAAYAVAFLLLTR